MEIRPKVTHRKLSRIKNEALHNASTSLSQWIKFPIITHSNGVIKSIIASIVIFGL